jgi:hypothetical protein
MSLSNQFIEELKKALQEKDELLTQLEKHREFLYSKILALEEKSKRYEEALNEAYFLNQNMHCFVTVGNLNKNLNEQTNVLRKALQASQEEKKK